MSDDVPPPDEAAAESMALAILADDPAPAELERRITILRGRCINNAESWAVIATRELYNARLLAMTHDQRKWQPDLARTTERGRELRTEIRAIEAHAMKAEDQCFKNLTMALGLGAKAGRPPGRRDALPEVAEADPATRALLERRRKQREEAERKKSIAPAPAPLEAETPA